MSGVEFRIDFKLYAIFHALENSADAHIGCLGKFSKLSVRVGVRGVRSFCGVYIVRADGVDERPGVLSVSLPGDGV